MSCLTPPDLLERFGAEELAQLCDRATPRLVTTELLLAAIAQQDLSHYTDEQIEAVGAALTVMEAAIADACSMVEGYLASRYNTPLTSPPKSIVRLAGDVARYYLHDDHATETVQKRHDAAIALLRDIAAGKVSLGAEMPGAKPVGGGVEVVSSGRAFSRPARGL